MKESHPCSHTRHLAYLSCCFDECRHSKGSSVMVRNLYFPFQLALDLFSTHFWSGIYLMVRSDLAYSRRENYPQYSKSHETPFSIISCDATLSPHPRECNICISCRVVFWLPRAMAPAVHTFFSIGYAWVPPYHRFWYLTIFGSAAFFLVRWYPSCTFTFLGSWTRF